MPIFFSHCLRTKQRERNTESYRPAWERGSGFPPGIVWHNVCFRHRNYLKLYLAALTMLELPPSWTLQMCSGAFLADRKVIIFLNICWIWGCEYNLSLFFFNIIANRQKDRNFFFGRKEWTGVIKYLWVCLIYSAPLPKLSRSAATVEQGVWTAKSQCAPDGSCGDVTTSWI